MVIWESWPSHVSIVERGLPKGALFGSVECVPRGNKAALLHAPGSAEDKFVCWRTTLSRNHWGKCPWIPSVGIRSWLRPWQQVELREAGPWFGCVSQALGPSGCKPAVTPTGNQRCSCVQTEPAGFQTEEIYFISQLPSIKAPHSGSVHLGEGNWPLFSHIVKQLIHNLSPGLSWIIHVGAIRWHGPLLDHSCISTLIILLSCRTGITHKPPPWHTCSLKALGVTLFTCSCHR